MVRLDRVPRRRGGRRGAQALEASVVDAALARARVDGWDRVRLSDVARDLKVPLSRVVARYPDRDAIADAWFARARDALADAAEDGLEAGLLAWFDALAPERRTTARMLRAKCYPAHPHHWLPMAFSLSRIVQLWRDAAGRGGRGFARAADEMALSALFLAALALWCGDESPGQERTRAFVRRALSRGT